MTVLNQEEFFYLETHNNRVSTPPEPKIRHGIWPGQAVRNWDDKDYWYVEFTNGDAFFHYPIEKLAGKDIYDKIKLGQVTLCISNVHEAYHYVIDDIYRDVVIESGIDPNNILYLTNSADIANEIEIVSKKYNLPKIRSEFISLFEMVAQRETEDAKYQYAHHTLNKPTYDKKFITLNGLWRPHRLLLVSLIKSLNLIHHGHVSLNACTEDFPSMDQMFPEMLKWTAYSTEANQLLIQNEYIVKQLGRLYIDTDINGANNWKGAVYHSLDKSFYEDTYFSVVTETLCSPEFSQKGNTLGRAISEKTFKPILHHHPFMILGVPGVLKLLKQLGYKTFSPYIDESYDDEEDVSRRCYLITKEVERLCELKGEGLQKFLNNCKPIVEHNYNVLMNKKVFNYPMT